MTNRYHIGDKVKFTAKTQQIYREVLKMPRVAKATMNVQRVTNNGAGGICYVVKLSTGSTRFIHEDHLEAM